jgi:hypothetical protein
MDLATPSTVYLKDYAAPSFLIPTVELDIDLVDESNAWIRVMRASLETVAATAGLLKESAEVVGKASRETLTE